MKIAGQMNINLSSELPHGNNFINTLGELTSVQDGIALFKRIIVFLCSKAKENRKDIEYYNLQRILHFIDNHINEDLSMDTVSEHLNLSASHIYSILRRNLNKSFVEYLTEKKLEKACVLLGQGMKIKEIAETLGYSSSKYFIYVFKRNKGVSPNQFKCIMNS